MTTSTEFATRSESTRRKSRDIEDDLTEILASRKKSTWLKAEVSVERRDRMRSCTAFEVEVSALNEELKPLGKPQPATILNYSEKGVCLEHASLIPEQYISISWSDSHQHKHTAIVRLKWCRSTHDHRILSGGCVCGIETVS